MQYHRRLLHFLERGAKSGEQSLGKVANEPDRVGNEYPAIRRQANGTNGGIKRREHTRGNQDLSLTERIEQRRFTGIGIAHQRDGSKRNRIPCFASQGTLSADRLDASLNLAHAI